MTRIIVIPDTQCKPGQDFSFLSWIGKYIADKKPDVIVQIGDFADIPSLSSYDVGKKSFEGRTYKADIEAAIEGMVALLAPIEKEQVRLARNKKKLWKPRKVLTLGNHCDRINRAIENDRKLEGLISTEDLLYSDFGWEVYPFLQPVIIEGICFSHYLCSGVMGRPITTARMLLTKKHMSCIVGHQQGRDVAYSHRGDGRQITSIIAGSCYEHNESFLNHQTNEHWRGIVVLNEVVDGTFDECFVSLNYLKKKYDSKK
jgi:hypothetical protein